MSWKSILVHAGITLATLFVIKRTPWGGYF